MCVGTGLAAPRAVGRLIGCTATCADPFEHALHAVAGGSSAYQVRVVSAQLLEREHPSVGHVEDVGDPGHAVFCPPEHLPLLGKRGSALGGRGVQHGVVQERHLQELLVWDIPARGAPGVNSVIPGVRRAIP